MRFSLLARSDRLAPRARALLESLASARHEVSVTRPGPARRFRRRALRAVEHPLATDRSQRPRPTIIWPTVSTMVEEADRIATDIDAWVARRPGWREPHRDLARAVPADPRLSVPVGAPVPERRPWEAHAGSMADGRHAGKTVVLAFRSTPASPGHLLRKALVRAGVEVRVVERIDRDAHTDADVVVVVESPSPPIGITGTSPIPLVFWVHHGEHHLDGNLRLARHYRADLVLLAHSWHLAARFDVPVQRFPFGVAPELALEPAWEGRDVDLAFVGRSGGQAYRRRRQLLEQAGAVLGRVEAVDGVTPAQMMELYGRSKAVLNEGGTRHLPITMRVFETVGAGALLVSDRAPGLEELFGSDYVTFGDDGLDVEQLAVVIESTGARDLARQAYDRAMNMHTYDHRVDLLMRYIDGLVVKPFEVDSVSREPVDVFLARHPYCQRILDDTGRVTEPGREVWRLDELSSDPKPGSFDVVAMTDRSRPRLAEAARRYVIGWEIDVARLGLAPRSVGKIGDLTVVDLGAEAYDVATVGGPSAFD